MDRLKIANVIKSEKVVSVYKLIFTFILLLCISSVSIADIGVLFCVSIVFTFIFVGQSFYTLAPIYFIANTISNFNLISVLFSFVVIVMLFSFSAVNSRVTKHKFLLFYTFFILTNLAYMLITYSTALNLVISLVKVLFNIVYVYISLDFFLACTTRGFDGGLNSDEYICGAVVLTTATIGLLTFSNTYFDIITPISVLLVLIFTYTFNSTLSLYFGAIIGLGYSIYYTTPIYISLFVLVSIISVAFKTNYKVFSVVGAVLSYILFSIYFIDYYMPNVFSIVSIIISGVIFQFTPLVVFESVVDILALRKPKIILLDVLNRSKHNIHSRLTEISAVFHQMDIVFRQMVKGDLDEITAKMLVKDDICHSLCKNCVHYKTCVSITDEMCGDMLSDVVNVAFAKNKMSVLDIPKGVATKCDVGALCSVVNRSMHDIKSYSAVVKNMDSSKLLIANQLSGMSRLINSLATDINVSVSFDTSREKLIVEELSYKNIVVYECMVYEKDRNSLVVNLILSDSCINIKFIEKVVSKCCNVKMIVVSSEPTEVSHLNLVTLSIAPNYSFVFGEARVGKRGVKVSGDNHTLIKIDDTRYIVAICDGMGNGSKANSMSSLALTLIENYYKAGFDDETIMSSINKLLMLTESETYSTVDLCVLDLKNNNYSFIKLGASVSFIKNGYTTTEVEGSGLPIGILENIKPHIIGKKISEFDTLILCSDGVVDSFGSISMREYVSSLDIINPQVLADTILEKAISNYGGVPLDDLTVVAVRLFPT